MTLISQLYRCSPPPSLPLLLRPDTYAGHLSLFFPRLVPGAASGDHLEATAPRILDERARGVLAQYLIELLSSLVLPEPLPQTIRDVDARLAEGQLCFPDKLMPGRSELEEFRTLAEKGKKSFTASLDLPAEKIFSALKVISLISPWY